MAKEVDRERKERRMRGRIVIKLFDEGECHSIQFPSNFTHTHSLSLIRTHTRGRLLCLEWWPSQANGVNSISCPFIW